MSADRNDAPTDPRSGVAMPWSKTQRALPRRFVQPVQQFLATEAASGILLFAAAVAALLWANLDGDSYARAWKTELSIGFGDWSITEDLRHWINDAAMALFFLVVGLEIKRELVAGELRDRRAALLPVIAGLGGMIVPAAIFVAVTAGSGGTAGWGIPMATDIAFALGLLAIVGRGLPSGLKVFLLTLAIVDDLGAILVIALFYSDGIAMSALGVAIGLLLLMVVLQRVHVRQVGVYLILGVGVWLAVFQSGIHATIAGVALAFITPATVFQRPRVVSDEARRVAEETVDEPDPEDADAPRWLYLAALSREAVSPLARLEHALHPWTSYVIVPLFALANAGVAIGMDGLGDPTSARVAGGIVAGLVLGKILGISFGAWIATRSGLSRLPMGVTWRHLFGVAALGGIGFTVSLFIASLAFGDGATLDAAKLGILAGSIASGLVGSWILARAPRDALG